MPLLTDVPSVVYAQASRRQLQVSARFFVLLAQVAGHTSVRVPHRPRQGAALLRFGRTDQIDYPLQISRRDAHTTPNQSIEDGFGKPFSTKRRCDPMVGEDIEGNAGQKFGEPCRANAEGLPFVDEGDYAEVDRTGDRRSLGAGGRADSPEFPVYPLQAGSESR